MREVALTKVTIPCGVIVGCNDEDSQVGVFRGIPYAKPPVGELRWREPQPVEPWEGEYQALKFGPMAMQFRQQEGSFYHREWNANRMPMSEDCLYLNVWTPAKDPEEKLPVAVWIHGGGFRTGSGSAPAFDGYAYAKRGIVFVSFNYRLNGFGFLAHPELTAESEHHSSGNYGMLDQVCALRWVKENIAAFGGDPQHITIFGQSSGAMSVQTLVCSDLTRGNIQRAIMQSAGGLGISVARMTRTLETAEQRGEEYLNYMGLSSIEEARKMSAQWLCDQFAKSDAVYNVQMYFAPNVDGYALKEDCNSTVRAGKHHDIPYIVGSTKNENWKTGKKSFDYHSFRSNMQELFGDATDRFLEVVGADSPERIQEYWINEFADHMYAGAAAWCTMQDRLGRTPSYHYLFSHPLPGDDSGAFHGCEHGYVFQTLLRNWRPFTARDYELSNRICDYWSNFMKTGNPNGEGLAEWTSYTEESPCAMEFGGRNEMFPYSGSPVSQFEKAFFQGDFKARKGAE